jgi:hypothetical protein
VGFGELSDPREIMDDSSTDSCCCCIAATTLGAFFFFCSPAATEGREDDDERLIEREGKGDLKVKKVPEKKVVWNGLSGTFQIPEDRISQ